MENQLEKDLDAEGERLDKKYLKFNKKLCEQMMRTIPEGYDNEDIANILIAHLIVWTGWCALQTEEGHHESFMRIINSGWEDRGEMLIPKLDKIFNEVIEKWSEKE